MNSGAGGEEAVAADATSRRRSETSLILEENAEKKQQMSSLRNSGKSVLDEGLKQQQFIKQSCSPKSLTIPDNNNNNNPKASDSSIVPLSHHDTARTFPAIDSESDTFRGINEADVGRSAISSKQGQESSAGSSISSSSRTTISSAIMSNLHCDNSSNDRASNGPNHHARASSTTASSDNNAADSSYTSAGNSSTTTSFRTTPPSPILSTPPTPTRALININKSKRITGSPCKESPAFYNPMSNYAPNRRRPRRREIMGMSIMAYGDRRRQPQSPPTFHDDDYSVESVDSELALEHKAQQIRTELRIAEMAELAAEAERAAEAGEEFFAAQPSTYGNNNSSGSIREDQETTAAGESTSSVAAKSSQPKPSDPDSASTPLPFTPIPTTSATVAKPNGLNERAQSLAAATKRLEPTPTKKRRLRRRSVSMKLTPVTPLAGHNYHNNFGRFRRPRKIAVMDLRLADDVFPQFDSFHNHLRTHFSRSSMANKSLTLEEDPKRPYGLPSSKDSKTDEKERSSSKFGMGSFSFESWRMIPSGSFSKRNRQGQRPPDPAARAVTCGDLVSCHQHDPGQPIRPHRIDVPPGLSVALGNHHVQDQNRLFPSAHTLAPTSHAVIHRNDYEHCESPSSLPPSHRTTPTCSPDAPANTSFVTPARLRGIRGGGDAGMLPEGDAHVPNSILQTQEQRHHQPTDPDAHLPFHEYSANTPAATTEAPRSIRKKTINPLMLPDYFGDSESQGQRKISLKPSSSSTNEPTPPPEFPYLGGGGGLFGDDHHQQQQDPPGASFSFSESESPAKSIKSARRVKVSVFNGTPELSKRKKVLLQSQLISIEHDATSVDRVSQKKNPCSCLPTIAAIAAADSSPGGSPIVSKAIAGTLTPVIRGVRRSTSTGALDSIDQAWTMFDDSNGKNNFSSMSNGKKHFEAAMDRLRELSPGVSGSVTGSFRNNGKNSTAVAPPDNDAFLNNYLYCSKPNGNNPNNDDPREDPDATCMGGESCRESIPCGTEADLSVEACCTSIMADAALQWLPHRKTHTNQIMLSRNTSAKSKAANDNWLDIANERFDGMLEKLVGTSQPGSEWNVSFKAPSLNPKARPGVTTKRRSNSVAEEDEEEETTRASTEDETTTAATPDSPISNDGNDATTDSRSAASSTRHSHHARHASMPASSLQWVSHEEMTTKELSLLYGNNAAEGTAGRINAGTPPLKNIGQGLMQSEPMTPTSVLKDVTAESITPVALSKSFDRIALGANEDSILLDSESVAVSDCPSECRSV